MTEPQYKTSIIKMLGVLDVKTVYYIDDELEAVDAPDHEVIAEAILAPLDANKQEAVLKHLPEFKFESPRPAKRRAIVSHLHEIGEEEKPKLLSRLGKALGLKWGVSLNTHALFLNEVFKGHIKIHCLGPSKWLEIRDEAIAQADKNNRMLCLFDQNLEGDSLTGIKLIREAIRKDNGREAVFCLLFTSEITGAKLVEAELDYWNKKVADSELASSKFFPLSKDRTQSNQSFAEGIKLSSLNSLYDVLREKTVTLLDAAATAAREDLNTIHLYNLDYMVNFTSKEQGIWEAATLLRLHDILREEKVDELMIEEKYPVFFNENIKKVAQINTILKFVPDIPLSERYKLRRQELYKSGKNLNAMHSEIMTCDVFRSLIDQKDFVVLAQPCDLTVRKNGKRKSVVVTAAPISVFSAEEYAAQLISNKNYPKTVFKLDYYKEDSEDSGYVEFNNTFTIEIEVLDLAVFSKEGKCEFDLTAFSTCPAELHGAWERRFASLNTSFRTTYEKIASIKSLQEELGIDTPKGQLLASLMPTPFKDISSNPSYKGPKIQSTTTGLDYQLQRISSIRSHIAAYLLDTYTKYLSRVAFDHDFSTTDTE